MSVGLDAARSSINGLTPDVMGVLALAGVFDAMSIIAGALTTAVTLVATKQLALHTIGGKR